MGWRMSGPFPSTLPFVEPPPWKVVSGPVEPDGPVPHLSVIVPFGDPRGKPKHLISWTKRQSLDGSKFEIVAVIDAAHAPAAKEAICSYLRPQDRLVLVEGEGQFRMYAAGAGAARGEVLVFTEDHCVAEAKCLETIKDHLETTTDAGVTVKWGHINHTEVAYLEQLANDIDSKEWAAPGHWNKVRIRGFAVRREAYRAAGGFHWEYHGFGEAVFAATLHAQGSRVGYSEGGGVFHINTETLAEIRQNAWDYAWGEAAYCQTHDEAFCERYFGASSVLARDAATPPGLAKWMVQAHWLLLKLPGYQKDGPASKAGVYASLFRTASAHLSSKTRLPRAWVRSKGARVRYHFWKFNKERRLSAFKDYWSFAARLSGAVYSAKHGSTDPRPAVLDASGFARLATLGSHGIYPVENFEGRTFRWTAPVAVMTFQLPAEECRVLVNTGWLRGAAIDYPFQVFWNRKPVPEEFVRFKEGVLHLRIKKRMCNKKSGIQELTLAMAPLKQQPYETRWLGLPICSLQVLPGSGKKPESGEPNASPVEESPKPPAVVHAATPVAHAPAPAPAAVSASASCSRIVLVSTSDSGGGAEVMAQGFLEGYQKLGHHVSMLVGHKNSTSSLVRSLFQHAAPKHIPLHSMVLQRLRQTVQKFLGRENFDYPDIRSLLADGPPVDALHLHNLHGGYFDLRSLGELSTAMPVFLTVHDSWLMTGHCATPGACERWETGCGRCPDLKLPPALQSDGTAGNWKRKRGIYAKCRLRIGTPSRWLMDRVQRSMLAPGMIEGRVIPNGIDLSVFHPVEKRLAREKLPVNPNAFLLVYAAKDGAANLHKDFATVRSALGRLAQSGREVCCVVLGREAATENLANGVTVQHLPMASPREVAAWFQGADLFVHSAPEEIFGLVLAEALACGTPVIASAVGGVPEVIHHEEDGLLVPPREPVAYAHAIEKLLASPELRTASGQAGAARARKEFGVERMVRSYAEWIDEVLVAQRSRVPVAAALPSLQPGLAGLRVAVP